MRISIAMATYNGGRYIQEQLDSFLVQTRRPDELVVCDDGSDDATVGIVQNFKENVPFEVVVIENPERLGHVKNFEKALAQCSGDIVFLSDQDDVWFPGKIEKVVHWLVQNPDVYVVQSDMEIASKELNPSGVTKGENVVALGHGEDRFQSGCGAAVRRQWLDVALPIPERGWGHDNWLHRLALVVGVRGYCRSALMYYRRHEENASQWLASRGGRVTVLDSIRAHGLASVVGSWKQECIRLRDMESRLKEESITLNALGLGERTGDALSRLRFQRRYIESRIACMGIRRWRRAPHVLVLWSRGGYEQFSGWKSAVKDLVRP